MASNCSVGFRSVPLLAQLTGAQIHALATSLGVGAPVFPLAVKVANLNTSELGQDIAITGFQLSTTIINQDVTVAGVFFGVGCGNGVSAGQTSGVYMSHITGLNSYSGRVAPANRSNGVTWTLEGGIFVPAGTDISLLMTAANNVDNLLTATCMVYWVPVNAL